MRQLTPLNNSIKWVSAHLPRYLLPIVYDSFGSIIRLSLMTNRPGCSRDAKSRGVQSNTPFLAEAPRSNWLPNFVELRLPFARRRAQRRTRRDLSDCNRATRV